MAESELARVLRQSLEEATPRTRSIFGGANSMSATEVEDFFNQSPVGLVSTIKASGAPHITGVGMVYTGGKLYLGLYKVAAVYRNLRRNSGVAVGVVDPPWRRHVLIQGSVRFVPEDSDEIRQVYNAELAKHGWRSSIIAEVVPSKIVTWKG